LPRSRLALIIGIWLHRQTVCLPSLLSPVVWRKGA